MPRTRSASPAPRAGATPPCERGRPRRGGRSARASRRCRRRLRRVRGRRSAAEGSRRAHLPWERTRSVVCPPMSSRLVRLAAIATGAGAFSGLFGVGGGTIIVPLLILWLGYEEREATGTSLAAIVVIAAMAALAQ